jgi:ribosomal protein S18 acetylase RimI-like enzyme
MELAALHAENREPDLAAAAMEAAEYQQRGFPIYVAEEAEALVGYLVCRVDGDVVWAESLYVVPDCRRRGLGSELYMQAEILAQKLGGEAPYNWVHPNNDRIIRFLQKRGYNVLNLIELRRPYAGEKPGETLQVGKHRFEY